MKTTNPSNIGFIGQAQGRCFELEELFKLRIRAEKILEQHRSG